MLSPAARAARRWTGHSLRPEAEVVDLARVDEVGASHPAGTCPRAGDHVGGSLPRLSRAVPAAAPGRRPAPGPSRNGRIRVKWPGRLHRLGPVAQAAQVRACALLGAHEVMRAAGEPGGRGAADHPRPAADDADPRASGWAKWRRNPLREPTKSIFR